MTTKEQIIQALDQLPEPKLTDVLTFIHSLEATDTPPAVRPEVWQAYLDSEREREEVYRRLANS
ncbi:MAG: DUF2281 domain-containing protein [Stenomitos rutilans HA7619-LM2]|jgi:hypothetical protein|nr:DUF2281 domain-containing protein [Stenomitos rutilans HA7619-LM2]